MPRKLYDNGPNAQTSGIQKNHRSSDPTKNYSQGLNVFNNSYDQAFTQRYADIHPFMVCDAMERDMVPFRSEHDLGTYTLQSPLKSEVHMHKTVAMVPYAAILPNTWKIFYVNPTKGDDVPDDVFCNLNLVLSYAQRFESILSDISGSTLTIEEKVIAYVKFIIAGELIFSTGSLLSALKMNFHSYFPFTMSYDRLYEKYFIPILNAVGMRISQKYGDTSRFLRLTKDADTIQEACSIHYFLDVLREMDYYELSFPDVDIDSILVKVGDIEVQLSQAMLLHLEAITSALGGTSVYDVSLERPIAYQLSCVKFMSDDSIDNVFNARTFRNNFTALFDFGDFFEYNGEPFIYDVFSRHNLEKAFSNNFELACSLLFCFRKSLKYGDYFISSRPNPYAVGDVNAPVTNSFVSAIDITQAISEQRFTNWNNRVGMSYEEYVKGLTGSDVMPDITEPFFVAHEKFKIFGMEIENTGAAQQEAGTNSVTTLLKSTKSDWMYDIGITDACILIGLSHFDSKRLYTKVMDRNCLKSNRFDFFNKFYQYTGDQEIKSCELDASRSADTNFAYITRYMQYKQQVSHAGGGFVENLRSWAMVTQGVEDFPHDGTINSDFIRNVSSEFDRFYGSLTGNSLGNYFHFVVVYHNDLSNMRRAMDIAPDIL